MEKKLKEPQKINLRKELVLFLPFFSDEKINIEKEGIKKEFYKFSKDLASLKENEIRLVFSEEGKFVFLNVGEKRKWNQRKFLLNLRKGIRFLKENNFARAVLLLNRVIPREADLNNLVRQIPENILLADYEFTRYKEKPREGWSQIKTIEISWPNAQKYLKELNQGKIIGQAINFTRDLANTPGGEMTPEKLAKTAAVMSKKVKNVKVKIFDERKLKRMGMGGILGVSQGSSQKPRLIILKYLVETRMRNSIWLLSARGSLLILAA